MSTQAQNHQSQIPWDMFSPERDIVIAEAPGRLDVMGGIADYSGATVVQLPLDRHVVVAVQTSDDATLSVRSGGPSAPDLPSAAVTIALAVLSEGPGAEAPERLRLALEVQDALWAAYILGPLAVLISRGLLQLPNGLKIAVWSSVPSGAGVSSSAALEVAGLTAYMRLFDIQQPPLVMAQTAQEAEHRVALAPCGIMDQATSVLGRAGNLLVLKCQEHNNLPAEVIGYRRLPRDAQVYGIDSGVTHWVGGQDYRRVRVAAFMGRAIIRQIDPREPEGGHLCNMTVGQWSMKWSQFVPAQMKGSRFISEFGDHQDVATVIDPDLVYHLNSCTAHPIYEQETIIRFVKALELYETDDDLEWLREAGGAMIASHRSYADRCGLGTPETDVIVRLVQEAGYDRGLYGAKITGSGAGGTVAILAAGALARESIQSVADAYEIETGKRAHIIEGSGDGAAFRPLYRYQVGEDGTVHER